VALMPNFSDVSIIANLFMFKPALRFNTLYFL